MNNTIITCLLCEKHCDMREPYCFEILEHVDYFETFYSGSGMNEDDFEYISKGEISA